jgi:hypothetical protein
MTFDHDGESIAIAMRQQAVQSWLVVVRPSLWPRNMIATAASPEDCARLGLERFSSTLRKNGRPPLSAEQKADLLARLIEEQGPIAH